MITIVPWYRKNAFLIAALLGVGAMQIAAFGLGLGPLEAVLVGLVLFFAAMILLFPVSPIATLAGMVGLGVTPGKLLTELAAAEDTEKTVKQAATYAKTSGALKLAKALDDLAQEIAISIAYIKKHPIRYKAMRVAFVERIHQTDRLASGLCDIGSASAKTLDADRIFKATTALKDALTSARQQSVEFDAARLNATLEILEGEFHPKSQDREKETP